MSTASMIKVSAPCPIFDGTNYPYWKVMMRKRLLAMDGDLWTVTELGLTDLCKMANADDIRRYTQLDARAKYIICSRLTKDEFTRIYHLGNAMLIWDRISDVYEGAYRRDDPWLVEFANSLRSREPDDTSTSSVVCLMARGAKVTSREAYFETSSEDDSKCESKPNYKKLAKISTE